MIASIPFPVNINFPIRPMQLFPSENIIAILMIIARQVFTNVE